MERCAAYFTVFACIIIFLLFSPTAALSREDTGRKPHITFREFSSACDSGNFDAISGLISQGFDVNMQGPIGWTALTYVAANAKDESFAVRAAGLLVESGAAINAEDSSGRTAVVYAIEEDRKSFLKFLLDNGADVALPSRAYNTPTVFVPFMRKNPDLAYMAISKCANVNIRDPLGNTALSWASRSGYIDLVRSLIQNGAQINNKSVYDKTPLMEAAEKGHYEIAAFLVEKGANVDIQTKKGWSALMWASEKGYTQIVSMLIEANANLFAENLGGERALVIAQKNNHPETMKIIKEAEFRSRLKKIIVFGGAALVMAVIVAVLSRYIMNCRRSKGKG